MTGKVTTFGFFFAQRIGGFAALQAIRLHVHGPHRISDCVAGDEFQPRAIEVLQTVKSATCLRLSGILRRAECWCERGRVEGADQVDQNLRGRAQRPILAGVKIEGWITAAALVQAQGLEQAFA